MADHQPVLRVSELKKYFPLKKGLWPQRTGYVRAVDQVSFHIKQGETVGLVGESGCGKSTTGRTIMRLLNPTSGQIEWSGEDITWKREHELKPLRRNIQMIFQDPFASLNPRKTIGKLIEEPFQVHRLFSRKERKERVLHLLSKVGLDESYNRRYPHELSGGQRQRVGIARALALQPRCIIADEPVSALDVSVQSQIINLLQDLQEQLELSYLFISHDLSVVKHICDRVAVMYLGTIVEMADKASLYQGPLHPYSAALLSSVPQSDPLKRRERVVLQGDPPDPAHPPQGCLFHTRCPQVQKACLESRPRLQEIKKGHFVACHLYDQSRLAWEGVE